MGHMIGQLELVMRVKTALVNNATFRVTCDCSVVHCIQQGSVNMHIVTLLIASVDYGRQGIDQ